MNFRPQKQQNIEKIAFSCFILLENPKYYLTLTIYTELQVSLHFSYTGVYGKVTPKYSLESFFPPKFVVLSRFGHKVLTICLLSVSLMISIGESKPNLIIVKSQTVKKLLT